MSIASELENYRTFLTNAYNKCEEKEATMPTNKNLQNLEACIESIQAGSGGGGSVDFNGGTEVTVEASVSISAGSRFVGVKNADATVQIAYADIGASDMAVVSEDLSVGLVATALTTESTSLQIGFLTDDYTYELVDVPIPSGTILGSASISSTHASINEDGTLIVVKELLDSDGVKNRVLIIDVSKSSKSATIDYQDNFGIGDYDLITSTTYKYELDEIKRTGTHYGFCLTKNYLIYSSAISFNRIRTTISSGAVSTSTVTNYSVTSVHKYNGSSFSTKPIWSIFCGASSPITNCDNTSYKGYGCRASAWYNDNTLLFIHGATLSQSAIRYSKIHKLVLDGSTLVSHTVTSANILQSASGQASTMSFSKNGLYIGYYYPYSSSSKNAYLYSFNPLDMTAEQLQTSRYTALPYIDSAGEYYVAGTNNVFKVGDDTTSYAAKGCSSRHFEITGGGFYRSGTYKCFLSPSSDEAEYIITPSNGDCSTTGSIYGIVNEDIHAGEIGVGRKLFENA